MEKIIFFIGNANLIAEARNIGIKKVNRHTPGEWLNYFRNKANYSQQKLSTETGIPQPHISAFEHNKKNIGKKSAKKIAKVLKIPYQILL